MIVIKKVMPNSHESEKWVGVLNRMAKLFNKHVYCKEKYVSLQISFIFMTRVLGCSDYRQEDLNTKIAMNNIVVDEIQGKAIRADIISYHDSESIIISARNKSELIKKLSPMSKHYLYRHMIMCIQDLGEGVKGIQGDALMELIDKEVKA